MFVTTVARKYFIAASSEEEMRTWMQKLNAVLIQFRKQVQENVSKQVLHKKKKKSKRNEKTKTSFLCCEFVT